MILDSENSDNTKSSCTALSLENLPLAVEKLDGETLETFPKELSVALPTVEPAPVSSRTNKGLLKVPFFFLILNNVTGFVSRESNVIKSMLSFTLGSWSRYKKSLEGMSLKSEEVLGV